MRSNSKNRGSIDETSKSDRGARSIPRFLRADRREGRFSKEADVSLPNTSQKGHLLSSDQIKPCFFFLVWGGWLYNPVIGISVSWLMSANGFVAVAHLSWDLMIGVFPQFTLFLLMFFVTCFSYFKAFDLPIYLRIKTTAGTCPLEMLGLVSMKNSLIFWIMLYFFVLIHPWSLTWNRKMEPWKSKPFLEISIFRFYVEIQGCMFQSSI